MRSTSVSGANTAAILPLSSTATWVMPRPRALTASSASWKVMEPDATKRSVFAQAMSHRHVGLNAICGQQTGDSDIDGQHGWLRNFGLAQVFFRLGHCLRVVGIDEDELGKRLAQQRRHHAICFGERLGARWALQRGAVESMLAYCEPWPVYRKATLGAGPCPRKIPCARSAFQNAA